MPDGLCPNRSQLYAYLSESLLGDEADAIEQHVEHCSECLSLLSNIADNGENRSPSHRSLLVGRFVGPYKLVKVIGEGGMGTVFSAEQTEPFNRKAALKVIRPGMESSKAILNRFERERQALAMLDHPNIATVFDAGVTAQGVRISRWS